MGLKEICKLCKLLILRKGKYYKNWNSLKSQSKVSHKGGITMNNENKTTNIPLDTIDRVLYGNITNTKQDVVELIINELEDDKKRNTLLKAYKDTVAEGYPFNIEGFIKRAGVKVEYIDLPDNHSGYIGSEDECTIYVNKNHGTYRQRFTMAHEMAHYIMHGCDKDRNATKQYTGLESKEEAQANTLAGAVLMPYIRIIDIYKRNHQYIKQGQYDILGRLQAEFDTSIAAISVMLSVVGLMQFSWSG